VVGQIIKLKMGPQSIADKGGDAPLFGRFARCVGATVALSGSLIIASWYADWRFFLQMLPGSAPMQYNTALCFILSGAGLFLLPTSRARIGSWLSGAVIAFTLLTMLEYLTGLDFRVDELVFKP